jgi:hypothetical protein
LKFGLVFILCLVLLFVGIIIGYVRGLFSQSEVGVIVSVVGALGTLILATVTVFSLLETRVQVRQREREQDKLIEEQVLVEIKSLLETVEENDEYLSNPEGYWTATYGDGQGNGLEFIDVEVLSIDHPIVKRHFAEKYPEAKAQVEQYNNHILDILKRSRSILEDGRDSVEEYIEANSIEDSNGELVKPEEALSLVLSEHQGRSKSFGIEYPDWWDWELEIKRQLEAAVGRQELEEFFDTKSNLRTTATNVQEELNEVRDEILEEYPVQPQS